MKKLIYIFAASLFLGITSCDMDRLPIDAVSPEAFFNTENDLRLYTNSFYTDCLPIAGDIYTVSVDDMIQQTLSEAIQGKRIVPQTDTYWHATNKNGWRNIRRINFYLQHSPKVTDVNARRPYDALARFFRAFEYYKKVQRFGDVPWYNVVIDNTDTENLMKPRDSRTLVMDSIIADLDYAITYLPEAVNVNKISKWTALAFKSRVCLYEGTWRKYHTEFNLPDADKFLDLCIKASEDLMTSKKYKLYKTGDPSQDYLNLFASLTPRTDEMILMKSYDAQLQIYHNVNYFTLTASYGKPGLEKEFVNHYLMRDGKRFTDKPNYNQIQFYDETIDRDYRLSQSIRTPGYTRIGSNVKQAPMFGASVTGYQIVKYVMDESFDVYSKNTNPMPIMRYAEVLLNYAEAKAERGTLTQEDLKNSVNLLRDRVGMPQLIMNDANNNPCPFLASQYKQVNGANKGVILEIRRERAVEMIMEGLRWEDIMRWKEGAKLSTQYKGMYFPGAGQYDLDGDGKIDVHIYDGDKPDPPVSGVQYLKLNGDITLENGAAGGCVTVNPQIDKKWDEQKDYLYPIPIEERLLNPGLVQNPHWDDGL